MIMAEYIERNALLEDISESVVHTVRVGYPSPEVRGANKVIDRIKAAPVADVVEVKHGEWETVHGVLTPGGDPLKRCPYCKSRESEHLDGVEHPSRWMFCPICGAKMDKKEGAENVT